MSGKATDLEAGPRAFWTLAYFAVRSWCPEQLPEEIAAVVIASLRVTLDTLTQRNAE